MNERRRIASVTESAEDLVCVFQKFSFTELVLKRRSAWPLIKPFFVFKGWQDEKCVYCEVSVGLKWVCELRILTVERQGPLNISVSRKATCSGRHFTSKQDCWLEKVGEVYKKPPHWDHIVWNFRVFNKIKKVGSVLFYGNRL